MVKLAVLGGGINGVTCALKIKEKYDDIDVVLFSKEFSPHTTGDGSGGLWYPYLCGNTPAELLTKWGAETYTYLHQLWLEGGLDVSLQPVYCLYRTAPTSGRPAWADSVLGYRELDTQQLQYLGDLYSVKYAAGHTFTTYVVQPPKIIQHLFNQFISAGGRPVQHSVNSLKDPALDGYDVVVNCTGLGARSVVPDERTYPIRGQIFKTAAPWMNVTVLDKDTCHYIIPNAESCVLGGTSQEHNYSTEPNEADTNHILNGCRSMVPGFRGAQIVNTWVGLRPGRDEVRLEAERGGGRLYIHNYGHGGSGLTLFWGCANDVLSLLDRTLQGENRVQSKL